MIKTFLFTLVATAAIARADISPSTIAHFKEWAKTHRTSFIQSYTYSAEQKAFIETPAVDNDEFAAVALGYLPVPGKPEPSLVWMVYTPTGSFLYADGMDPWPFVDPAVHP
jgi:hypothetical protein